MIATMPAASSTPRPPPAAPPRPERLRALAEALGRGLLEREAAVRLALLAALAGEHVLLIGPPGTAKSALARRLHGAFAESRYFERLLTRFSTPEELFGPLSLKALEDDRYERLVDGFLPTAGIAFLDEVFKASSAILNALLTLLNEREFDNGTARTATPLVAVVAASNEVPADEALHAFYDRFLVRVPVSPVGDASFAALLALRGEAGADAPADAVAGPVARPIGAAERAALAAAAAEVALGEDFLDACHALRRWLAARGAALSDRRWRQFAGLVRTAAASEGRACADRLDLWLAPFVASARPEDVPELEAWFLDGCLQAPPPVAPWLTRAVEAFEQQLSIERSMPAQDDGDGQAGKLAVARAIGRSEAAGPDEPAGAPRIVSARLEAALRRRWSPLHLAARLAQLDEVAAQLAQARAGVAQERSRLAQALAPRLWLPPALQATLLDRHAQALALLDALAARIAAARAGFAALPCDPALPAEAPPPVVLGADGPAPDAGRASHGAAEAAASDAAAR